MAITEQEKVKARHHTGYLNVAEQSTFSLGIPAGVQTQFVIEGAFKRILPQAEEEFRRHLRILDEHEQQILENMPNVAAESLGQIKVNLKAFREFVKQYRYWVNSMCNLMGIVPNPFDQRFTSWNATGGGINASVSG
jgi:hypothetical protein